MTKKERDAVVAYLSQYINSGHAIKQKTNEITKLRDLINCIVPVKTSMPPGNPMDLSEAIADLVVLEREIKEEVKALVSLRQEIRGVIENLEDKVLQNLLTYKYINGIPLYKIAGEISYNYRNTRKLHKKAIEKLKLDLQRPH